MLIERKEILKCVHIFIKYWHHDGPKNTWGHLFAGIEFSKIFGKMGYNKENESGDGLT